MKQVKSRLFFLVISLAALGFVYSSGAGAAKVLFGTTTFSGKCVDTQNKALGPTTANCSGAPSVGYLYSGPNTSGNYTRNYPAICWSRPLAKVVGCLNATGFVSASFSPFRIEGGGIQGDITAILGDIDPDNQLVWVVPGAPGTPAMVTISMPDVLVKGYATDTEPDTLVGQARFSFEVVFRIPIAAPDDFNKGGGNNRDCSKCDPGNPKKGSSCTGCSVNQTCTNLDDGTSQFAVKAFCVPGLPGLTVAGELKLLPGQEPPTAFPGCTDTTCTLKVGGLPLDLTACGQIFDQVIVDGVERLALYQMLSFQQHYEGACKSAILADLTRETQDDTPLLGLHRECHSDSFNGVARGCVQEGGDFKVAEGGDAAIYKEVTIDLGPTVNLKCDAGRDSGTVPVGICTTSDFNALDVDTDPAPFLIVEGDTFCNGEPCHVQARSHSQGNFCGDFSTDRIFNFWSCKADGSGLAQAILRAKPDIKAGERIPVTLRGAVTSGIFVIQGTDDAQVVSAE